MKAMVIRRFGGPEVFEMPMLYGKGRERHGHILKKISDMIEDGKLQINMADKNLLFRILQRLIDILNRVKHREKYIHHQFFSSYIYIDKSFIKAYIIGILNRYCNYSFFVLKYFSAAPCAAENKITAGL